MEGVGYFYAMPDAKPAVTEATDVTSTEFKPPSDVTRTSPNLLVYGGTASSKQDAIDQKKRFETNRRRQVSDSMFRATHEQPGIARMHTRDLQGKAHIILEVRRNDNSVWDWLVCDISTLPTPDGGMELMLLVPCPVCVLKQRKATDESIMQIRQSNRGFTLDTKRQGEMWVNPNNPSEVYLQAGTVNTHEPFRCDNGCRTRYAIDNNVIRII